jgi:hypothetical protein
VPLRLERRLQSPEQVVERLTELGELVDGAAQPRRWFRLLAEIARADEVIARSGRTTRPASSQPAPTASTTMTAIMATPAGFWLASWATVPKKDC